MKISLLQPAAALLCSCGLLRAATVTWDNSNTTNAWSTAANWDTNVEPLTGDDVIFPAGLSGGITLLAGENAKTLQFNNDYTLTGGGLTLASASTMGVLPGKTATINSPLTITGGTTKTGDGMLVLGGSNNFTGGIAVNAGTLRLANASGIGGAANTATVHAGAILEVNNAVTFDRAVALQDGGEFAGLGTGTGNGIVTVNAAAASVNLATRAAADVFTVGNAANDFTGGGAATVVNVGGPGAVRLGFANNYAGLWRANSGTLQLGAAGALGTNAGVTALAGGSLAGRAAANTTFTGPANLDVIANSSLLSDRSSASAGLTYTWGTLSIGAQTLTVAPGPTVNSGTATVAVGNVTLSGNPTFAVNDLAAVNGRLLTGSLLGGGVPRTIIKSGDGDLAITGGATDLPAGSQLNASGAGVLELLFPALGAGASILPTAAQHPLGAAAFTPGGGLRLLADGENTATAQTFVLDHDLALSGSFLLETDRRAAGTNKVFQLGDLSLAADTVLNVSANNGYKTTAQDLILAGAATIQGTTGKTTALNVNALTGGAGTLTLGGPATHTLNIAAAATRSGGTIVTGGVVNANAGGALGSGPLAVNGGTVNAAGTLGTGAVTVAGGALNSTGNLAGLSALNLSSGTLTLRDPAAADTALALNGGTLDLRSNTPATFTFNSLTLGGSATLNVANNGSGAINILTVSTPLLVAGNHMLTLTQANSYVPNIAAISLAGDLTLSTTLGTPTVQTVTEDGTPRKLLKAGTGTITLEAASTFSGGVELLAGNLDVEHTGALGSGPATIGPVSGTATTGLRLNAVGTFANPLTVRAGGTGTATIARRVNGTATLDGAVTLQRSATFDTLATTVGLAFNGPISGAGDVTIAGGVSTLANAANSFGSGAPGSVTINSGILNPLNDGALGAAGNGVTIAGGQFLASSSFATARTFTLNAATNTFDVNDGVELTLNSALAGTGTLRKFDNGTITFGPGVDSSARGAASTDIVDGTVRIQNANALSAAGPVIFNTLTLNAATLALHADASTNFAHPLQIPSGGGIVHVDRAIGGSGTGGTHSLGAFTGTTPNLTITGANGYGLALGSLATSGNLFLTNNAPGVFTFASLVHDTGGSTRDFFFGGTGDMVPGTITQNGGGALRLTKTGPGTLRPSTDLSLFSGFSSTTTIQDGTLNLNGTTFTAGTLTLGGAASASGARIVTGAGKLVLTGATTYSSTSNPAGALIEGNVELQGTPLITVANSTNAPVDMEIRGVISGPGGFTLGSGSGVLRLTGSSGNTFAGAVTVGGNLELAKTSGPAIGAGGLNLTSGSVRLLASNQIPDNAAVAVNGGANFLFNGFDETLGALTLTATATSSPAVLQTGAAGRLTLNGALTLANNANSSINGERVVLITGTGTGGSSGNGTPALDGVLDLGGALRTIAVTTTVTSTNQFRARAAIETVITNGGIHKTGTQPLVLRNPANSFALGLNIANGDVEVQNPGALGTGPVTFNSAPGETGRLVLINQNTAAGNVVTIPNALTIGGTGGVNGIFYNGAKDTTLAFSAPILLNQTLDVDVLTGVVNEDDSAILRVDGQITDGAGSFGILKRGKGELHLAAGNDFDGGVTATLGRVVISADSALGSAAAPLTMAGGALSVTNSLTSTRPLNFTAASTFEIGFDETAEFNGPVTLNNNDIAVMGSGTVRFTSGGGGTGRFIAGSFLGPFADQPVTLNFGTAGFTSLGAGFTLPSGDLQILNGHTLELPGGSMTRAPGTAAGQILMGGAAGGAGFAARGADLTVNLGGAGAGLVWGQTSPAFLHSIVAGGVSAFGSLRFGSATATHTVIWQNPLELDNGGDHFARLIRLTDGPAALEARMTGAINFGGVVEEEVTLEVNGGGALECAGPLTGALHFNLSDDATVTFSGANTYTGRTEVFLGRLIVAPGSNLNGSRIFSIDGDGLIDAGTHTVTADEFALISEGSRFIGNVNLTSFGNYFSSGTVQGDVTAQQFSFVQHFGSGGGITGNLTLAGGSIFTTNINGPTPGFGMGFHDQLNAGGTVALNFATLEISDFSGFTPHAGEEYVILKKNSAGPVSGIFSGLAEGATITMSDGTILAISYAGGDGNDVSLTAVFVPVQNDDITIHDFTLSDGTGPEAGLKAVDVTATALPSTDYDLEASTDLVDWAVQQSQTSSPAGDLTFHITQSPAIPRRFFRVVESPGIAAGPE